ncbi:MAG: FG-GAP-like repeat-containing protein [Bacteroidota bacterium]
MTVFTESPYDLDNGQKGLFHYIISSHTNEFGDNGFETGAHYEVRFQVPQGLSWSGNQEDFKWIGEVTEWSPQSISYDAGSRVLTGIFELEAPFIVPKSYIDLYLTADCSGGITSGPVTVGFNVDFIPSPNCTNPSRIPIHCQTDVDVYLHCPGPCAEGLAFRKFTILRTNFGQPDENQDGQPDNSGSVNFDHIKRNRGMVGDTMQATFYGVVKTSNDHPFWQYGYATSNIEDGKHLSLIGTSLKVYDASSGNYITCDQVAGSGTIVGNNQIFSFDFSPASLGSVCSDLNGFSLADGDSVWLMPSYKITGNNTSAKEVEIANTFYVSEVANPAENQRFQCDTRGGKFTMIGYWFTNTWKQNYTINGCNKFIQQDFRLSIGDCCSNYGGGNLFPYEYRYWAHVKRADVVIPPNYEVLEIELIHRGTKYTNKDLYKKLTNIQADSRVGDTLKFNLEQYFQPYGGSIVPSDDGFHGTLKVKIAPTCDVPINTFQEMPWRFTFQKADIIGGEETEWKTCDADRVRFQPANLTLSSPNPTIDGLTRNITWDLNVKNSSTSAGSDNAWLHFKTRTVNVQIQHILDAETGDTLPSNNGIYPIGEVGKNKTRKFKVLATYSTCVPDNIYAYAGYECAGYPSSFESFKCQYSEMELHVQPKDAELQVRMTSEAIGDSCTNQYRLMVEMSSVQQAHVDSLYIRVQFPNGVGLTPSSAEFLYPLSGSYFSVQEPIVSNNSFTVNTWDLDASLDAEGLPGIHNLNANRARFRFDVELGPAFIPGEPINISIHSEKPCGQDLPVFNLPFDPSIKFGRTLDTGLDLDNGNSWGAAWGDYDGDGYEDLYVTDHSTWQSNYLYHNEGDGTFTKVDISPLTTDRGSGIGATWGDYDNDGDLDLFVPYNIQNVNHLYRNDGNGVFTRVNAGEDISNYSGYCHSASWVDFNNDGNLDLFVAEFFATAFNQLYKNNGDGTFSKQGDNPIVMEAKSTMGGYWGDYDNDGLQDLFVCNARDENNSLYHNDGNGKFTKITSGDIVNDGGNSLGASWGDYDNDGDLDLYVTNASNQKNFFYINNGDGTFSKDENILPATENGQSFGSGWADVDNDGDLDLFVTNDAGTKNAFYTNMGDGTFVKQDQLILNQDEENSLSPAFADFDLDGDLDLVVVNNQYQSNTVYKNEQGNCKGFKSFRLCGGASNASGIGARIMVKANISGVDRWQMRQISGLTGGVSAQGSLRAYFGVGDAAIIDSVIIHWPSGYIQTMTNVAVGDMQDVCEPTGCKVTGVVFHDENDNCVQDPGEEGIPNVMLVVQPGRHIVTTDETGYYEFYKKVGSYTVKMVSQDEWTPCEAEKSVQITNGEGMGGSSCGTAHFPSTPSCLKPNVYIDISSTVQRLGFRNTVAISYGNNGSQPAENINLFVDFDPEIVPLSSNPAWESFEVIGGVARYTWPISSLAPGESGTIMLTDSVSVQAEVGNMTEIRGSFGNTGDDCDVANNIVSDFNQIVAGIDPNDILVYPEGSIEADDTLTYKIRFQNVGNYFATRVIIKDTLSKDLDWSSIHIGPASHRYKTDISEDGVITFTFPHIMLPDSNRNEPKSHGFIQYKILPKANTPRGTKIENRAAIQFDFNPYLITNTVTNTIADLKEIAGLNELELKVSPNPMNDIAFASVVTKADPTAEVRIKRYEILSTNGARIYQSGRLDQATVQIRRGDWAAGIYILNVYDVLGFQHATKIVVK